MKTRDASEFPDGVPTELWGKDHWATFTYIETRCVDYDGEPNRNHMRTDRDVHPHLVGHMVARDCPGTKYPTRLRGGVSLTSHDDWMCLDDAEKAGLLSVKGTGMQPFYELTDYGRRMIAAIREHKSKGKKFSEFDPSAVVKYI